jgi:UDP-N-acetylglucosamine/UDP-N-acetylgalactosamine diphosphorylase
VNARENRLRERAARAGQAHVFDGFEALTDAQRERLLGDLDSVDFELVAQHAALLKAPAEAAGGELAPAPVFPLARDAQHARRASAARELGAQSLARGEVGFLVVAGGQASRLGYEGPKGAFPIGPLSRATLFELFARRIRAARRRYGAALPWYVMTSRANDTATREFFDKHGFFGLAERDVVFFRQAMAPALDFDGRILMSGPGEVFLAPNGHGGTLSAFAESGALDDAARRGVKRLSYFQVDNPLATLADPLFLGLHELEGARMSSKVVQKRDAAEKVGVIGLIDGRYGCIEYSDLSAELREARDEHGQLRFGAGNIALHAIDVDFLEELAGGGLRLPWHIARKSMSVWEAGRCVQRQGAKFETFVFDALARSPRSVVLEVDRAAEFSPVKNASGEDSPETTRADLRRLHAKWVAAAGLPAPPLDEHGVPLVEIDPLLADDEGAFCALEPPPPASHEGGHWYR